jgi:ferredoxin
MSALAASALIVADGGGFMAAVETRVAAALDARTRCGKCIEACPIAEPAGLG